jgi:predicted homoserine dehydrogenase-like protein
MRGYERRDFLKMAGAATAATLLGGRVRALAAQAEPARVVTANDHIQIALIGAGGQGQGDTRTAVQVPGVKLVAVADCYNGRLEHAKEIWGR